MADTPLYGLMAEYTSVDALLSAAEQQQDTRAALAIALFCYRARKYIGAYLAVLGGADAVIFGGGMTAAGEPFLERIRQHVRELAFPVPAERTRICYAQLGTDAGIIGAAGCGRHLIEARHGRSLDDRPKMS